MPHVSKYKLSQSQVDQLSQRVVDAILFLRNREDLSSFFNDLFSTTEKIMLGKRFLIAIMLEQGWSYLDIRRRLKVTDMTIASISERLKTSGQGFRLAIKQLERRENIDKILEKFLGPIVSLAKSMPKIAYVSRRGSFRK